MMIKVGCVKGERVYDLALSLIFSSLSQIVSTVFLAKPSKSKVADISHVFTFLKAIYYA
jgi:hypothetical protein